MAMKFKISKLDIKVPSVGHQGARKWPKDLDRAAKGHIISIATLLFVVKSDLSS